MWTYMTDCALSGGSCRANSPTSYRLNQYAQHGITKNNTNPEPNPIKTTSVTDSM